MSSSDRLIVELLDRGFELWAEGPKLRYRGRAGALDSSTKRALRARKAEVIERLGHRRLHALASLAQERLWFLEQLETADGGATLPAHNVPSIFHLTGVLDVGILRAVWLELTRRHESLRTGLRTLAGRALQVVALDASPQLAHVDLTHITPASRQRTVRRLADEHGRAGFGVASETALTRVLLLQLSSHEHLLCLTQHHAVTDARSQEILARELGVLYQAVVDSVPPSLTPVPKRYVDYALRQRRALDRRSSELDFWRPRLVGLEKLALPYDRPPKGLRVTHGAAQSLRLGAELTSALRSSGVHCRASLFMTLLAGWQALLQRVTGQRRVAVGSPASNRLQADTDEALGFFVNNLVLVADVPSATSWQGLVAQVRRTVLEALAHQELPFERLVAALQPARDLSRNPLFQVVFNLRGPLPHFDLPRLRLRTETPAIHSVRFDLVLHLWEEGDELCGLLLYSTALFDASTVARLAEQFVRLVGAGVDGPDQPLGTLPLLSRAERHQILREWNDTSTVGAPPPSLLDPFKAQVSRTPEAIAVLCGGTGEALSYAALGELSGRLAGRLRGAGVGAQSVVAILLSRSIEWVITTLAVLRAGGAYLTLDPQDPTRRQRRLLTDAGASLIVVGESPEASAAPERMGAARTLRLGRDWHTALPERDTAPQNEGTSLAAVVYTSGSTGQPRGVMTTREGLINRIQWGQRQYPLRSTDAVLQLASPSFDFAQWELLAPLVAGARVELPTPGETADLERLSQLISRSRVTVAHFVPSVLSALLGLPSFGRGTALRRVFCGGEALTQGLCDRLRAAMPAVEIDNQYGPTEASIDVTFWRCDRLKEEPVPIGRPIAGTSIVLVDRSLTPVPLGVTGELAIGGIGLARGYLGRPRRTAGRFVPSSWARSPGGRLYLSGDLGCVRADGAIEYLGRQDTQVKIRGFRIELGEVERALLELPAVRAAAVTVGSIAEPGGGARSEDRRLIGWVASDPAVEADARAWRQTLRRRLPGFMIPAEIHRLDELPRTARGKVDRGALARREPNQARVLGPLVPRTPIEDGLAAIWQQILRVDTVAPDDDFFALGGHSLLATQVVSRIRRALGAELPVRALFEAPTLAALARRVAAELALGVEQAPPIKAIERRRSRRHEGYPLSFAQERLWFLDRLEPNRAIYNVATAVRLRGCLDEAALRRALEAIVGRHASLRTRFASVRGRVRQVVADRVLLGWRVVDLRRLPTGARRAEALRLAEVEAARPFDLRHRPLLRMTLLRLDRGDHWLLRTVHHIVSDAWSTGVFQRELGVLYDAFARRAPSPLAALPIHYADYAVWQRRWLRGTVLERQLAYWQTHLTGLQPVRLPTDRPRPPVQTFCGAAVPWRVTRRTAAALAARGSEAGASLFMVLLATFGVLLHRHTGQRDLALASPIAGRHRRDIEALIGFFVNTQVLRFDLSPPQREDFPVSLHFPELLQRVRTVALDAFTHQDLPFEQLVAHLAPERDLSRQPLAQILFTLQNAPGSAIDLQGLNCSSIEPPQKVVRFDIEWHLWEEPAGVGGRELHGRVIYNTDLFDRVTVERQAQHFEMILEALDEGFEAEIEALPVLSPAQRHQLLREWALTSPQPPTSFLARCMAQAATCPDTIAVELAPACLSYAELARRSSLLAAQLLRLGVGPESGVALALERTPAMAIAVLAVLEAGAFYVPLDPGDPQRRLEWILEDSRARLILTDERSALRLPNAPASLIRLDEAGRAQDPVAPVSPDPGWRHGSRPQTSAESPAYLIYTSGSTGRPKGVLMRRGALDQLISWQLAERDFVVGRRALQFAALSFDVSVQEMTSTWCSGGTLVLLPTAERRDLQAVLRRVRRQRVERWFLPFVALEQVAELASMEGGPPATLREVITAGEPLRIHRALRRFFGGPNRPSLTNQYGPSETHVVTALVLRGAAEDWSVAPAIGRPIAGSRSTLLSRDLWPVPTGVVGQIAIGGASLARGYWRRPGRTAEKFVPEDYGGQLGGRCYLTGDLGRYQGDGTLTCLGRIDQQVKIRGFRLEPAEIEQVLDRHPKLRRAVIVVSEAGDAATRRLVAYCVPRRSTSVTSDELHRWLCERLPAPLIPARWRVVSENELPLTASRKLDRLALARLDPAAAEPEGTRQPPRGAVEEAIAEIFAEVLDRRDVAAGDDFFALGGHSLLAVRLMAGLEHRFGRQLPLATLFRRPTVAELAAELIEPAESGQDSTPLVGLRVEGDRPPFFCVHPGGGHVLCYADLCRHLGADQPFYALECRPGEAGAAEEGEAFGADIPAMAAAYCSAIRQVQPNGPYRLGGWSMGGLVAYEMACRLRAAGEDVALLALFDSSLPSAPKLAESDLRAKSLHRFARVLGLAEGWSLSPDDLLGISLETALSHIERAVVAAGLWPPESDSARIRAAFRLFEHNVRAMERYAPARFAGSISLFVPGTRVSSRAVDGHERWAQLALRGLVLKPVAGDHFSMMREPCVRGLARQLRFCLAEVA